MRKQSVVLVTVVVVLAAIAAVSAPAAASIDAGADDGQGSTALSNATAQQQNVEYEIIVDSEYGESYASDGEVTVWVGAKSDRRPAGNLDVTVEVEDPEGNTEQRSLTLDADGNAKFTYDLSGKPDGRYEVDLVSPSDVYASEDFFVGPRMTAAPDYFATPVGTQATTVVRVVEDGVPVTGQSYDYTLQTPTGQQQGSITTDSNGMATLNVDAGQRGQYNVDFTGTVGDRVSVNAVRYWGAARVPEGDDYRPGDVAQIAGVVFENSDRYANEDLRVAIVDETDYSNRHTVANISVTTDADGTFSTQWQTPDVTEWTDYTVRFYAQDGTPIDLGYASFDVRPRTGTTGGFDVQTDQNRYDVAPGESVTVTATVTNQAGDPVDGATVRFVPTLEFGDIPLGERTAQTNASGQASFTYTVPTDVPDQPDFEFMITATEGDRRATASEYVSGERYRVETDSDGRATPGQADQVSVSITNAVTGSGVSDQPVTLVAVTQRGEVENAVASASARTDASGEATLSVDIPASVESSVDYEIMTPQGEDFESADIGSQSASFADDIGRVAPGETVTTTFQADADTTAIVTFESYSNTGTPVLPTQIVSGGDTLSFTVPSNAPADYYSVSVLAITENGAFSETSEFVQVDEDAADDGGSSDGPPAVSSGNAPTDPDGDGVYEDVNGDGNANVVDVQALFANLGSSAVTNNQASFDFNGDGSVNILDVQALFAQAA